MKKFKILSLPMGSRGVVDISELLAETVKIEGRSVVFMNGREIIGIFPCDSTIVIKE